MTPYQRLKKSGVKSTFYSPDGFSKIEEFDNGERYHHHPSFSYPIRMSPVSKGKKKNPSFAPMGRMPREDEYHSTRDLLDRKLLTYNGTEYWITKDGADIYRRTVGKSDWRWFSRNNESWRKFVNPRRRSKAMMPIVAANPELLLIGNPRRKRRRRRKGSLRIRSHRRRRKNGGKSRGIHRRWGKVTTHKRRVNRGRRGGYAGFVKKHKALFKRMTFRQATRKIASMWKRK